MDKGLGLRDLCEHLQIDLSETIAIGDNFNDVGMLREAGLSAAVANAVPEIKEMCDYVCTADHNEGAVAEVIERFILSDTKAQVNKSPFPCYEEKDSFVFLLKEREAL